MWLAEAQKRGLTLVAALGGEPMLVFEEAVGASPNPPPPPPLDYRIVSAKKTSTVEEEIVGAVAQGFRAIAAGDVDVIMERAPGSPSRLEYRLVATTRVDTSECEPSELGAQGFRIVVTPRSSTDG